MSGLLEQLFGCVGFQWDEGNADKNWIKHRVSRSECEEVFFNEPFFVASDTAHSSTEPRFYALGRTHSDRLLFMAFTIRGELVRIVSARDMSKGERREYERGQTEAAHSEDSEV
ncbi:MAG: BrnT family toxin [Thermodesulfobacteriota bacterium]